MSSYSEALPGTLGKVSAQWRNRVVSKEEDHSGTSRKGFSESSEVVVDGEDPENLWLSWEGCRAVFMEGALD